MDPTEKDKLIRSLTFPGILLVVMWVIRMVEYFFHLDFTGFGIYPQHITGLRGIFLAPLLHAGFAHLAANSVPLFVLSAGLFYFYDHLAYQIFSLLWLITGFWVWVFAKDTGIHIGASGVVYALAAFHFTIGLIKREPRIMAFSMLVIFLYGGLIWGIIPNFLPDKNISWESHLMGLIAGVTLAFFYRNNAPKRNPYSWEEEDDDDPDEEPPAFISGASVDEPDNSLKQDQASDSSTIIYHYKESSQ